MALGSFADGARSAIASGDRGGASAAICGDQLQGLRARWTIPPQQLALFVVRARRSRTVRWLQCWNSNGSAYPLAAMAFWAIAGMSLARQRGKYQPARDRRVLRKAELCAQRHHAALRVLHAAIVLFVISAILRLKVAAVFGRSFFLPGSRFTLFDPSDPDAAGPATSAVGISPAVAGMPSWFAERVAHRCDAATRPVPQRHPPCDFVHQTFSRGFQR